METYFVDSQLDTYVVSYCCGLCERVVDREMFISTIKEMHRCDACIHVASLSAKADYHFCISTFRPQEASGVQC